MSETDSTNPAMSRQRDQDQAVTHEDTYATARRELDFAMSEFYLGNRSDYHPLAFLTRAWFHAVTNNLSGAQEDLDEAWEIAERGPMRLHMADIHLYRARLSFREKQYPWESQAADLAAARKLIEQCGYWRRKEELDDAEEALRRYRS